MTAWQLVLVALLGLSGGCRALSEIVVRVDSAVAVGASFTKPPAAPAALAQVCFHVTGLLFGTPIAAPTPEPRYVEHVALRSPSGGGDCLPVELGVVARGEWTDRDLGIEVRGQTDCVVETAPFLYARAIARFTPDAVTLLTLELEADCPTACSAVQRCDHSGAQPTCVPVVLGLPLPQYSPPTPRCP